MILLYLLTLVQGGQIQPYLRKPIEPSVNNALETSDYTFTFTTETDMFSGDQLLITFPSQYALTSPCLGCSVTMLKWNPDLLIWQNITGSTCQCPEALKLQVTLPDVKAGNYKLTVPSIVNPSYGGTGNFKLETRRNAAFERDINLVDYNYAFGKVGIAKGAPDFSSIAVTYSAQGINSINQVIFTFTTTQIIPQAGKLTLDLSQSILTLLDDKYSATTTLQGNITRSQSILSINGFDTDQAIGGYTLTIYGVLNPTYSGIPGQFTLRTWTNYTNTILNQKKIVNLPNISPGVLTSVILTSHSTLGQVEAISINDATIYQVKFQLKNAVEKTGIIQINWMSGGINEACYVTSGLYDQSESAQVTCTYSGTVYSIVNFKRVQPKTQIVVQFKVTNPASSPLLNYEIKTYQDAAATQLVDTFSGATGITLQSYPQFNVYTVTFPTADHQRAAQTATWLVNWCHTTAPTVGQKLKMIFSSSFTFSGLTCSMTNDVAAADGGSCSVSGTIVTYTFGNAVFSTTASNKLTITGIKNPTTPGEYPLSVNLLDSSNVVLARRTVYLAVWPYKLTSISTFRLSNDQGTKTLIYFKFPALQDIPSSQWNSDYNVMSSEIWVEFQTSDTNNPAPANYQFKLDLGTGLSDGAVFPCYGYSQLQPLSENDEIKCSLNKPTSSPDPARVKVNHFKSVLSGGIFELHLPNIQNPICEAYTVTVDDLCRSTAAITIKLLYKKNRIQYIMYQNDATDPVLILPAVLPNIVVGNPLNNVNGVAQPSPSFVPTTINTKSTIQIRYQPGSTKTLQLTDTSQGIIFIFPQLQTTIPQAYIVNKNVKCNLGLLTALNCYAYREVGWIVVIPTTILSIPGTGSLDVTFYLQNFMNPFYAAVPNGYITIITVRNTQQWEKTIFQDLPNFTPGSVASVQVTARKYQANMIDVQYNWLFSFNDDIPAGGKIQLIYAVNFYDHGGSNRHIAFTVNQGLTPVGTAFSNVPYTNIYTLWDFKPYTKGTVISITMTGVKNPPKAGLTNYFGVASLTQENYYIDSKTDVTPFTIITQVAIGEIIFNHFKMHPDNGSPTGSVFPATYEVSFYPTRNIPKKGTIIITFPSDFDSTSFLDDTSDLRCYVSGALTTMENCDKSGVIIKITLDTELRIEAGMQPVIVTILNIRNFSEDKSSGVVVVQTIYDAVVLDDSGTTDTNRKATTGLVAKFMTNTQYSLIYYPLTEGVLAQYIITLIPSLNITTTATIIVEFPVFFPYGLGGSIGCDIPLLSKASNDPIQCSVSAWSVTLSNLKSFTTTTDGFTIALSGVRNPNQQIVTKSQGIRVYIMSNSTHAQEYVDNLGALSFTPAAPILDITQLIVTSSNTRDYADYTLSLLPEVSGTATNIKLDFQICYQIAALWSAKQVALDGTVFDVTTSANSFLFNTSYAFDTSKTASIVVNQLPNPLDEGICPGYPDVSLYDNVTKTIIMQTYWNLIQPSTPDFTHAGKLIIIDDDNPNHYIEAGTFTNNITLSLYPVEEASTDMSITPVYDDAFKDILSVTTMNIESGSKTGQFRIGVDTSISVLRVVIKFSHSISGYIPLRPIYLWIQRYKNISITVSSVSEVYAGGRSEVQNVQMSYGPFKPLTFSFHLLNNLPTYCAIYPSSIILTDGSQIGKFWVSCGQDTQGATGSVLTIISGDDKSTFQVATRLSNFTVINPDQTVPFIVSKAITATSDTQVTARIVTNEPCTIYFAITPTFIREVTFSQIKNKTLPYDYFNYSFTLGEFVYDSPTYDYQILVDSLTTASTYQFLAYVEDFSGNLANEPIKLYFNTTNYVDPLSSALDIKTQPTVTATTNTSLTVSGLGSIKAHAIAIKYPSYIFVNHFSADSSVLRSRRFLATNTSTNNTTTYNTTKIDTLSSDPWVPKSSDYSCKTLNLNYLTQLCQPVTNRTTNFTRIDYYDQQLLIPPTGLQVSRGENYQGILVQHYTSSSSGTLTFNDLSENYDYFIFIAQESNGQFSNTSLMVKGTTRTEFILNEIILCFTILFGIMI